MVIKYHIYTSKITPGHARFEFDGSPRESREQFHCPNIFLIRVNEILLMKNCHENKNIKEYSSKDSKKKKTQQKKFFDKYEKMLINHTE